MVFDHARHLYTVVRDAGALEVSMTAGWQNGIAEGDSADTYTEATVADLVGTPKESALKLPDPEVWEAQIPAQAHRGPGRPPKVQPVE